MLEPIEPEALAAARGGLPNSRKLATLAARFALLADPARLAILLALRQRSLSVRDVAILAGLSESATSHHLHSLRRNGLVEPRRDGRVVHYALSNPRVVAMLDSAVQHASATVS